MLFNYETAKPSALRRMAIGSKAYPPPDGVGCVLVAAAAVGAAIDAHRQGPWPSFGQCEGNPFVYGEGVYDVLAEAGASQIEIVKAGYGALTAWAKSEAPVVTKEDIDEAVDPT